MVPRRWLLARLTCATFEGLLPVITAPHTEANYITTLLNTTKLHGRDVIIGAPYSRAMRAQVICRAGAKMSVCCPRYHLGECRFSFSLPAPNIGRSTLDRRQSAARLSLRRTATMLGRRFASCEG